MKEMLNQIIKFNLHILIWMLPRMETGGRKKSSVIKTKTS
jgi:hypothetical protein